jgi:hypothetical protein
MNDHCPVFGRGTEPGLMSAPVFLFTHAVEKRLSDSLRSSFVFAAYEKYASFLMTSRALHPGIFEPSVESSFRA